MAVDVLVSVEKKVRVICSKMSATFQEEGKSSDVSSVCGIQALKY